MAFLLETFATVAVGVHLIPYLTERGDGAAFAAGATGLIGAAQVGARVVATVFGGRLSPVALTAWVFGLQAIALAVLMGWPDRAGVLIAVLLLGAGRGVVTLMRTGLVAEFYGRAHYGAINGMLALFLAGARALGPGRRRRGLRRRWRLRVGSVGDGRRVAARGGGDGRRGASASRT